MAGGLRDRVDFVRVTGLVEVAVWVLLTDLVFSRAGGEGWSSDCSNVNVDVVHVVVDVTAVLMDANRESSKSIVAAIFQINDRRIARERLSDNVELWRLTMFMVHRCSDHEKVDLGQNGRLPGQPASPAVREGAKR